MKNLDTKRINSHKHIIFSTKEDEVKIECPKKHGLERSKSKFIHANVYTEIVIEDGCKGQIHRNILYPDSNFDSGDNYVNFDLHFETNYLKKLPGITDTKLPHVLAYLENVKTEVDVTEIHQFSQQLGRNDQDFEKIDSGNEFIYKIFGGICGLVALTLIIGGISLYFFFKSHASRIQVLEGLSRANNS